MVDRFHPGVLDVASSLGKGKIKWREFLRFATLLGASANSAYTLAEAHPLPQLHPWLALSSVGALDERHEMAADLMPLAPRRTFEPVIQQTKPLVTIERFWHVYPTTLHGAN